MNYLQRYRFPASVFLLLFVLVFIIIKDISSCSTIVLNSKSVVYSTSSGGRWGTFSHDQEIWNKTTGRKYIKTYRTFCLSNLFASPQKAMAADHAYLVLPLAELNKISGIKYYTLTTEPKSAFSLFFHILAYIISNHPYLILPLLLLFALFKKELSKEYQYESALHKYMINAACYAAITLVVLFGIY